MARENSIEELEASIQQFYERYSAKKLALAAFMVGVFTFGFTYVAFALTGMTLVAIVIFGIVGFFSVNLTMVFVVPPSKKMAESRELICSALREPSRIKEIDTKGVKLTDEAGTVRTLSGPELEVWTSKIVPYFMQTQSTGQSVTQVKADRTFTTSERKYIEDRRREVLEIEKKIDEARKELKEERKEIEKRRSELLKMEKNSNKVSNQSDGESTSKQAIEPDADEEK